MEGYHKELRSMAHLNLNLKPETYLTDRFVEDIEVKNCV
jgi:hypothetical protein